MRFTVLKKRLSHRFILMLNRVYRPRCQIANFLHSARRICSGDRHPVASNDSNVADFEEDGDEEEHGRPIVGPGPGQTEEAWRGELAHRLHRERFLSELRARDADPQVTSNRIPL